MNAIVRPGNPVVFMKVGVHAREPLEAIIERKLLEIEREGMAFWGYGGNTCHPTTMIQPFAQTQARAGNQIVLCMQRMQSNHFAEPVRAEQYSADGTNWHDIPAGINAVGSRFALVIGDLREADFDLPLNQTQVALGPSRGRSGSEYISGRVDKACLELGDDVRIPQPPDAPVVRIGLTATLREPYAVFLRNR